MASCPCTSLQPGPPPSIRVGAGAGRPCSSVTPSVTSRLREGAVREGAREGGGREGGPAREGEGVAGGFQPLVWHVDASRSSRVFSGSPSRLTRSVNWHMSVRLPTLQRGRAPVPQRCTTCER